MCFAMTRGVKALFQAIGCVMVSQTVQVPVMSHLTVVGASVARGGGGFLGPEKGTDCDPTTAERWLLLCKMAKNGGLSSYYIV